MLGTPVLENYSNSAGREQVLVYAKPATHLVFAIKSAGVATGLYIGGLRPFINSFHDPVRSVMSASE